jgi:hypothetical protein
MPEKASVTALSGILLADGLRVEMWGVMYVCLGCKVSLEGNLAANSGSFSRP